MFKSLINKFNEKKYQYSVRKRNARFAKLTPEQKRVAIAQDVILQLNLQKYQASHGVYLDVYSEQDYVQSGTDLQCAVDRKDTTCSVCAIGAVFTSRARLGNSIVFNRGNEGQDMVKLLGDVFSAEQLRLMEVAFEGKTFAFTPLFPEEVINKAIAIHTSAFDEAVPYEERAAFRLRTVMENVIRNNGEFVL